MLPICKVVWYSHLFKNFPQFVVIHTVKGWSVVNEAEVDVFLEFLCFFYDPTAVGNFGSLPFLVQQSAKCIQNLPASASQALLQLGIEPTHLSKASCARALSAGHTYVERSSLW